MFFYAIGISALSLLFGIETLKITSFGITKRGNTKQTGGGGKRTGSGGRSGGGKRIGGGGKRSRGSGKGENNWNFGFGGGGDKPPGKSNSSWFKSNFKWILLAIVILISLFLLIFFLTHRQTNLPQPPGSYSTDKGSCPNIVFILADDLGWNDIGYSNNPSDPNAMRTPNINKLFSTGLYLKKHYAHWHCSPSRRMFLTGRLVTHTGTQLTNVAQDNLDKRFPWISEHLKNAQCKSDKNMVYKNYWIGKGHTGYKSAKYHLAVNRGFDERLGYLTGSQSYKDNKRWKNGMPYVNNTEYSNQLYGEEAVNIVNKHNFDRGPMFMYFAEQSVHAGKQPIPPKNKNDPCYDAVYGSTMPPVSPFTKARKVAACADVYIGKLIDSIKKRKYKDGSSVWDNTLMVFVSDNGGTHESMHGNNWPLRGEKRTTFEGGIRVVAAVNGGFLSDSLRGKSTDALVHIRDWYATFSYLAGVSVIKDSFMPVKPADNPNKCSNCKNNEICLESTATDISNKYDCIDPYTPKINMYGETTYPGHSSKNLWPLITNSVNSVRDNLIIGNSVIISGDYKLMIGLPCSTNKGVGLCKKTGCTGWKKRTPSGESDNCKTYWDNTINTPENFPCLSVWYNAQSNGGEVQKVCIRKNTKEKNCSKDVFRPCLFNLAQDPYETKNINDPNKIQELWGMLNNSLATLYTTQLPGKENGLTPGITNCNDMSQIPVIWNKVSGASEKILKNMDLPPCDLPS